MESLSGRHPPCDAAQRQALADALGDTPETVIAAHAARRGLCRAYVAGDSAHFAGVIVQTAEMPGEPMGFGEDADVLWNLLRSVEGWFCIEVARGAAPALGRLIQAGMGRPVRFYEDIYSTLTAPAVPLANEAVRLLTPADLPLLDAAPPDVRGAGFGGTRPLLAEGIAACALVGGTLVAIAHTSARTPRHADIGVATLPAWRGRGFASAAAALVAQGVQGAGQIPMWSTGVDNQASRRVARKLGFVEVARRTYVILA